MKYLVIHGPNLNLLATRDPEQYGSLSMVEINNRVEKRAKALGAEIQCFQSNGEGEIIDFIQKSATEAVGVIINPGAYGHYSYAIHDALLDTKLPVIEVHLSNVQSRDEWRRKSVIAPATRGVISGFGWRSYTAALDILVSMVAEEP